jgi:hypothetical protein
MASIAAIRLTPRTAENNARRFKERDKKKEDRR